MLIPIVLSGGAGSRLWPVSRKSLPKPFIKMEDGMTLYGKTIQRLLSLDVGDIMTVTNRDYYFISKDVLDELGVKSSQKNRFLLETRCTRFRRKKTDSLSPWPSWGR